MKRSGQTSFKSSYNWIWKEIFLIEVILIKYCKGTFKYKKYLPLKNEQINCGLYYTHEKGKVYSNLYGKCASFILFGSVKFCVKKYFKIVCAIMVIKERIDLE